MTVAHWSLAGACMLALAAAQPAQAQQEGPRGTEPAAVGATGAIQKPDARAASSRKQRTAPDAAARASARNQPRLPQTETASRPWTIDQALPGKPVSARGADGASGPGFGRVPLESGSFGFETSSQFKENRFSDGRPVPGLETVKRQDPSYFGLSLSVPANDPGFLPLLRRPD